jgi:hypothetical protein
LVRTQLPFGASVASQPLKVAESGGGAQLRPLGPVSFISTWSLQQVRHPLLFWCYISRNVLEDSVPTSFPPFSTQDLARRNLLLTYALPDRAASLASAASHNGEDDNVTPSEACVICLQRARRAVFLYCGHRAACMQCATAVAEGPRRACPLCRQPIHGVIRVYDP